MENLSFFTYNKWTGTSVRGTEIASYLGAKLNVREGTVIHVKPPDLNNVLDGEWVDVLDGGNLIDLLKARPKVNAIAISEYAYEYMNLPNKTVCLPQQHINWDREKRMKNPCYFVAGYIGAPSQKARRHYDNIAKELKKIGIEFVAEFDYKKRRDAINFYKRIDVLVVSKLHRFEPLKTPTKMINAASFGLPSIAIPMEGYKEWEGNYIEFQDLDELYKGIEGIKNNYELLSEKMIAEAEKYHISKIAEKYKALCAI